MGYEVKYRLKEVLINTEVKYRSFLQDDTIPLGIHSKTCPNCRKQQIYNIFAI